MRKGAFITILFFLFLTGSVFSQEKSFHSIQEALNHHITQIKGNINKYNNIFIVTTLEDSLVVSDRVFQIENALNAKFLKKTDENFLVKLIVHVKSNPVKIDAVNFRVVKHSNRKIGLVNLGNGASYIIK